MSENHNESEADVVKDDLAEVQNLLAKHRLVEEVSRRQDSGRHDVVENLVSRQHIAELRHLFGRLPTVTVALVLSALPEEDRLIAWKEIAEERIDSILELLSEEICEDLVGDGHHTSTKVMVNAFELHNGRLRQITVDRPAQLANINPIWVDLVAPTPRVREWVGKYFDLEVPDPEDLTDLEASARFYIEDNGEVHLHSDFLLDLEEASRNVAVAFILHKDILFSVRTEELPVFRLQRLRARTQPGYVTDGTDVLLDLYAADAEYSADRLEDVYAELEDVGKKVLNTKLTDDEAGNILADIARQEDLNGRIRRNVLDTRRALSFLMRGKFLSSNQIEDARQIMRDIESLDGHTSFLFGKINFLMDTTVGFININQNKIVKLFSVVSVGLLPPTLIASVYGMNFQHMPELQWEYGYPFSLVLMLASVTAPFWYFRKKGWLS
ncbi:MAG: magnesium/cobalt transporter CorA [Dechloromonas sp.]|jgi:magnesium transporter|uniref:Magnesium transport protein CorA n=1 Tax=Candidatus Dechloromonas phosphorivorans TaxID=2899244 RepID=A0A935JXZ0_9RHOO|nr:magnesium/cobalt transporter CorA [Candidatus Dechloromonas phosphorivorans]